MPTAEQNEWIRSLSGLDPITFDASRSPDRAKHDALLDKGRQVWLATRRKVESDISGLLGKIQTAYKGHDMAKELEEAFMKRVEPVLVNLDEGLAHKLDDIRKSDGPERAKLVNEARALIASYEKFLDTDDVVDHLDRNPVVPLTVRKTLDAALDNLGKVLG